MHTCAKSEEDEIVSQEYLITSFYRLQHTNDFQALKKLSQKIIIILIFILTTGKSWYIIKTQNGQGIVQRIFGIMIL